MSFTAFQLLSAALAALAGPPPAPGVGDTYELSLVRDSSEQTNGESSGGSHDQDFLMERVIAIRPDGLELEYDLPAGDSAAARAGEWQLPARVLRPDHGPLQLLNRAELETRLEAWLKKAKMPRAACGHWIFTWNAFQIDCDPQSVLKTIEAFDLRVGDLREGALYRDEQALAPAPLVRKASGPSGSTFFAELQIDPESVRREEAESDVVVGEIMHHPVTLEAALRERAKESVSGSFTVTLETDSAGNVVRRTKVGKVTMKGANGATETRTITQVLERRLVKSDGR
jgi:hypothetical protein